MDNKMFFTIVIPAYNCQKTINRLLDSIKNQDIKDYKIIITDDSDKFHPNLYDYIKPYCDTLDIYYYKREKEPYTIHCPGNTRHSGLKKALEEDTEYIMFVDCDDEFEYNTFLTLKNLIIGSKYPAIFGSKFKTFNEEGQFLHYTENNLGWLHGKCFKKDFLKQYNLQFKIDMVSHEDTYFNCLVNTCLIANNLNDYEPASDFTFYKWYERLDSTSHEQYYKTGTLFLEEHYNDYCSACLDSVMDYIQAHAKQLNQNQIDMLFKRCCNNFSLAYLYFQGFLANGEPYKYGVQNYISYKNRFGKMLKMFNVTKERVIDTVYSDPNFYNINRTASFEAVGLFIEQESFKDFINNMKPY